MKYIKLFEEFNGSPELSLDLIESLNRYRELIERYKGNVDSREYFDILLRISDHMIKYRDIFEYVLRMRFDSDSDRLDTIVKDLRSLFLDLGGESLSKVSSELILEISDILYTYSHMIGRIIDIRNYYSRSSDMESMTSGMREESDILEGIMSNHVRFERLWKELLLSFDSVERFEEKRVALLDIMNLLDTVNGGDVIIDRFRDLLVRVSSILGDIIEGLNNTILGGRDGIGEIGRMSEYYSELESSEVLVLEGISEISGYIMNVGNKG